ncbi:PAAR domain-containing protein [Rahnella inusitata]|uniref:PAAR domain-containing protein n=1 Tax=Rahnella inusitata TaxID=58169 RepID=UPI001BC8439B|nr:PAAR domain-containing protein [Rahnella inusitata]QUT17943.1 PAAR domain-containing protein [Rahnella inusitata]
MAKGYYLVIKDKTTCGGIITEGDPTHTLFGKAIAREQDRVTCGKHPGMFIIVGHIPGDSVMGRKFAGTLHSKSSCPCQARFIPSMINDTYAFSESSSSATQTSAEMKNPALSSYVTGETINSGYVPDYPATALINTNTLPDMKLRGMLQANNQDIALLTPEECIEVLSSWGTYKSGWLQITQSAPGAFILSYGTNIKDVVTTSMIISQLGNFGIKATNFTNAKGTELIKISGYPGVRKVLNAPVFAAKNPKIVDLGIGKFGVTKSIIEGTRVTFYVAAAYRILDYILNDETTLSTFIGSIATDVIKIGIVSIISFTAGVIIITPFIALNLAIVVGVGFLAAWGLNKLDEKFGMTDQLIEYIEHAQQEFVEKAREMEKGFWDLGAMFADEMLIRGKIVIESEVRNYLRDALSGINLREY